MTERITPYQVDVPRSVEQWDPFTISAVLDARAEHTEDMLFGEGARYKVGPKSTTQLSVFPDHNAVMVTTPEVAITMRRPSTMTLIDDAAFFDVCTEKSHTTVVVSRDGTTNVITTQNLPPPVPETDDVVLFSTRPEKPDPRRLVLAGSVIHEPHVCETPDGEPEIRFPLATDSDDPEYHNVYSTKKYAQRIIEKDLQRGDPVKVVGVRHEFPDGVRIYAYGVKRFEDSTIRGFDRSTPDGRSSTKGRD